MANDDVLTRHLREARAEFPGARVRIDADVLDIDRMIAAGFDRVSPM